MVRYAYRLDPDFTVEGRHYAHHLISWSSVIAGAITAIAVGFGLNLLGLAIGAGAFNPYDMPDQSDAISIGGGLYFVFAQLVAFQIGGYVAARSARFPDHFGGSLTGLLVWSLAVFVALVLATFSAAGVAGGDSIPAGVAETITELNDATEGANATPSELASAEDTADVLSTLSWWGLGALALGFAGSIAGGWLGAYHPKWEKRPRLDDRAAYQISPDLS